MKDLTPKWRRGPRDSGEVVEAEEELRGARGSWSWKAMRRERQSRLVKAA